jgi:hypothetical protein
MPLRGTTKHENGIYSPDLSTAMLTMLLQKKINRECQDIGEKYIPTFRAPDLCERIDLVNIEQATRQEDKKDQLIR